jgi:hypothetical protein
MMFIPELDASIERQKQIALWSFILFALLFVHMLLDPILHWNKV